MEITLTIPDEVAPILQNGGARPLSRRALELLALDGYKSGELSEYQVKVMLGFDDRFEVDAFLKAHGVYYDYSPEEIAEEMETIEMLQAARS